MNDRIAAAEDGLRFFGRVTASISHEISNVLATIYENAGLVEDFISASERGRPLDPNRLKDLASRVRTQVRRGKDIVENMNRFAHSVDEPWRSVDLAELLSLSASLAQRTASMHEVALELEKPGKPVHVRTDPFLLQNLIWLCLDFIMGREGSSKTIRLVSEANEKGACIRVLGLRPQSRDPFPTPKQQLLGRSIGASLSISPDTGEILIDLQQNAGDGQPGLARGGA